MERTTRTLTPGAISTSTSQPAAADPAAAQPRGLVGRVTRWIDDAREPERDPARSRVSRRGCFGAVGASTVGVVALTAGLVSLVFLLAVGLAEYAVALAFVVALLDVIPMIGATLGAVVVSAIGFATDVRTGVACVVFFLIYQQLENYVVYPRVMSRSVDIPGAVAVIAALVGASLLGVVGALLAIPMAAAVMLVLREVVQRRQDVR